MTSARRVVVAAIAFAVAWTSAARASTCEELTAAGRRDEAIAACARALQDARTNANLRALVRALVAGPAPTTAQLATALTLVTSERAKAPNEPTLIAASCDVAVAMGEDAMLRACSRDLDRVAPDSDDARRARALLDARCPDAVFWGGWGLLGLAVGATAVRAIRLRAAGVAVAAAALLVAAPARADATSSAKTWLSKWPVDDASPASSIPSERDRDAEPMEFGYWLQDLALKAERASARGDHAASARFYEALAAAVPDRAVGLVKACAEYESMGARDQAIDRCGAALLRDGATVDDYARFVRLMLAKPGPLAARDVAALTGVIAHMKGDPAGRVVGEDLECEAGARASDVAMLERCTAALAARGEAGARVASYRWALAMARGDTGEASRLVEVARAAGVDASGTAAMRAAVTDGVRRGRVRAAWVGLVSALAAVIALALVRARGLRASARAPRPVTPT